MICPCASRATATSRPRSGRPAREDLRRDLRARASTEEPVLPPTRGLRGRGRGVVKLGGVDFRARGHDDTGPARREARARRAAPGGFGFRALRPIRVEPDGRPVIRHMGASVVWVLFRRSCARCRSFPSSAARPSQPWTPSPPFRRGRTCPARGYRSQSVRASGPAASRGSTPAAPDRARRACASRSPLSSCTVASAVAVRPSTPMSSAPTRSSCSTGSGARKRISSREVTAGEIAGLATCPHASSSSAATSPP